MCAAPDSAQSSRASIDAPAIWVSVSPWYTHRGWRVRILSRRRALAFSLSGVVLAGRALSQTKARALCLIGDRYHNPDYIRVGLEKVFIPLGIKADYTIDYESVSSTLLKQYDLFLILRDGMIWPQGYLGPDAYSAYAQGLENRNDFAAPKSEPWIKEEQALAIHSFGGRRPRASATLRAARICPASPTSS